MKKLQPLLTGLFLILIIVGTFSLIMYEFKNSIKTIDAQVQTGTELDRKLLEITKVNTKGTEDEK